jgi:hypothetical protein
VTPSRADLPGGLAAPTDADVRRDLAVPTHADVRRDLSALDRRGFLRLTGLLAAAGWLPAGCGDAPPGLGPPPGLALVHLSPRSYAVLNAAAARIAGPRGGALVEAGALDPARAAERFLAGAPELAAPLGQALLVLEFAPWPLLGKLRPFTALPPPGRDAVLSELMRSRLETKRRLFQGLRSLATLAFQGALAVGRPPGYAVGAIPAGASIDDALTYAVE